MSGRSGDRVNNSFGLTLAEITSGLEEGEEVVVGPYRSLKDLEDGDRVRPRSQDDDDDEEES